MIALCSGVFAVNNIVSNPLAFEGHRLFSLWEMIEYFGESFLPIWERLDAHLCDWRHNRTNEPCVGDGTVADMKQILQALKPMLYAADLMKADDRLRHFYSLLESSITITPGTLKSEIEGLQKTIIRELGDRKFAFIPNKQADFFEQNHLFGEEVSKSFPSAVPEIKEAGNCLAADLNTAAVFHLMRIAEVGMRAFALQLKVKLNRKPITHGGWSQIIEQIEKKIRRRRERYDRSGRKNKKEFEFLKSCRMAADELFFFKEMWRDNTMHAISNYSEPEARGIFERVRNFMQRLAKIITLK